MVAFIRPHPGGQKEPVQLYFSWDFAKWEGLGLAVLPAWQPPDDQRQPNSGATYFIMEDNTCTL